MLMTISAPDHFFLIFQSHISLSHYVHKCWWQSLHLITFSWYSSLIFHCHTTFTNADDNLCTWSLFPDIPVSYFTVTLRSQMLMTISAPDHFFLIFQSHISLSHYVHKCWWQSLHLITFSWYSSLIFHYHNMFNKCWWQSHSIQIPKSTKQFFPCYFGLWCKNDNSMTQFIMKGHIAFMCTKNCPNDQTQLW